MTRTIPVIVVLASLASPAWCQFGATEVSGPGSPSPFLVTKTGWSWEDLGCVTYSIHRSDRPDAGFSCRLDGHSGATWTGDPDPVPASGLWHYVVTAFDGTTDNSPGTWSDGTPRAVVPCVRTPTCSSIPVPGPYNLRLVRLGTSNFASPMFLTSPAGDDRIFVLERAGRIQIQHRDGRRTEFLDFSSRVVNTQFERGALGLAFHPNYACNGKLYVHYSGIPTSSCGADHCSIVAEYTVSADPDRASPASERILLQQGQFAGNHNGGWIAFGPDGMLYVAFGDGGNSNDTNRTAQDCGNLLGKVLRIDVDRRDAGLEYAVPPDNPFVSDARYRPEIWIVGVRNPWRMSFDRATGDLYIGDVGQRSFEEIDVLESNFAGMNAGRGANLGWSVMEGDAPFNAPYGCDPTGFTGPVLVYSRVAPDCASVTGGYVYRGCRMPDLQGTYFLADYCMDWIETFEYVRGSGVTNGQRLALTGSSPVSFGEDSEGELYLLNGSGGVFRIEP